MLLEKCSKYSLPTLSVDHINFRKQRKKPKCVKNVVMKHPKRASFLIQLLIVSGRF